MAVVGRSDYTHEKQADYRALVGLTLSMCHGAAQNPKWRNADRDRLHIIDLHAGDGGTADEAGSPLIVAGAAERLRRPVVLWMCEEHAPTLTLLQSRMEARRWQYVDRHYLLGSNDETVDSIKDAYRAGRQCFGWIYSDPNGDPIPVKLLRDLLAIPGLGTLDVKASVNANGAYKRTRHLRGQYLKDDIEALHKKMGYIRHKSTGWQWTMLFLTNFPKPIKLHTMGFYGLETARGQEILTDLNYTKAERQLALW